MAFALCLGHRRSSQGPRPGTGVGGAARTPPGPPGPGHRRGPAPRIKTLGEISAEQDVPVTVLLQKGHPRRAAVLVCDLVLGLATRAVPEGMFGAARSARQDLRCVCRLTLARDRARARTACRRRAG